MSTDRHMDTPAPEKNSIISRISARIRSLFSPDENEGKRKIPREVLRFQPDRVLLERADPPLGARWTLYAAAAFLVCVILWACLAPLDKFVIAEGRIVTAENPLVLQSYSLSIVKEIRAVMGQKVKKGEVLAVLDPTFSDADMATYATRVRSLEAHKKRLECELSGEDFREYAEAGLNEASPVLRKELLLQQSVYEEKNKEYDQRLRTFDENMNKLKSDLASSIKARDHKAERLKIYSEFEKMQKNIYDRGLSSRAAYLEALKDRHTVAEDLLQLDSSIQELTHEIESVDADRQAYIINRRNTVAQEMVGIERELDSARESLAKASRLKELSVIRAPMDAVVLEVARRSEGSVMDEAEQVVTLIPLGATLEAELEVSTDNIGYVRVGQPVLLKLATLPFQKHGKIDGEVSAVSEDIFQKQVNGGSISHYRVRVRLPQEPLKDLRRLPEGFALMPGMSLSAEINVGERRVIEYFLYPVLEGFDTGLREPR